MKQTEIIMGMPITVEIADAAASAVVFAKAFDYFRQVDQKFSTYKPDSEVSRLNRGKIQPPEYSAELKTVLGLSEETKKATKGFFDIKKADGTIDPSGLVKGWSIWEAALMLRGLGLDNFYIDAGGDAQMFGEARKIG